MIPLTMNEIRRLFNRVTKPIKHAVTHVLHWSLWRRRSQERARISHHQRNAHHNLSLSY
jgi:hypothetical protein